MSQKEKLKELVPGSERPNWKGDLVGYSALHRYLRRHYGKAFKCESPLCEKKSDRFEWALKKGKIYNRNKENYIMLCFPCHRKYDFVGKPCKEETKIKIRNAQRTGSFIECLNCGKSFYLKQTEQKRGKKFCSYYCVWNYKKNELGVKCKFCGISIISKYQLCHKHYKLEWAKGNL